MAGNALFEDRVDGILDRRTGAVGVAKRGGFVGNGRYTSGECPDVGALSVIGVAQRTHDRVHVDGITTGEEVGCAVAQFRPRVHGQVTFGYDRDPRNAVWRKAVHENLNERRPACLHGIAKRSLRGFDRIEIARTPKLANHLLADAVHRVWTSKTAGNNPGRYSTMRVLSGLQSITFRETMPVLVEVDGERLARVGPHQSDAPHAYPEPTCPADAGTAREDGFMAAASSTEGRLLVAAPALIDPSFDRTVVLMLEHNADGAIGLVLNRPTDLGVEDALSHWAPVAAVPGAVFDGGPVDPETAFCLALVSVASPEVQGWKPVVGRIGLADLDVDPFDIAPGIEASRVFCGYAGWSAGQLERELREEAWFVVDAQPNDAITDDPESLWEVVLRRQRGPLAWVSGFPDDPNDN